MKDQFKVMISTIMALALYSFSGMANALEVYTSHGTMASGDFVGVLCWDRRDELNTNTVTLADGTTTATQYSLGDLTVIWLTTEGWAAGAPMPVTESLQKALDIFSTFGQKEIPTGVAELCNGVTFATIPAAIADIP